MPDNQDVTRSKLFIKANRTGRLIAGWICIVFALICIVLWLAAKDIINIGVLLAPCGFKMRTGLPCPTCGYTTAALAFFRGDILKAFYIQPAAALLCVLLILAIFLSFITAVFGVYFSFLKSLVHNLKPRHMLIGVIIVILGGWAVTIARALS
ncbi:MAG: DUF2752 domain-containing protein [Sedimentisphaerales bacterium]|nr:DUF2752 domain-containing protein [Sedimentisphaerales bacterium]